MATAFFGTDGIRGHVGQGVITPKGFLQIGWILGQLLAKKEKSPTVVIGRDPRLSGHTLTLAFSAGFLASGGNVLDAGIVPTPAVAYLTKTLGASAGAMVSASHNPYFDNGIKFFASTGFKLPKAVESEIEQLYEQTLNTDSTCGQRSVLEDAPGRYLEYLKAQCPNIALEGMRIVIDAANGAGYQVAPQLLKELGAQVFTLSNTPDGLNINDHCGATNPDRLSRAVLEHRADVGLALDGDGDRLIAIDHKGNIIDGDAIVFILAKAWHQNGALSGGVVGTKMSNLGQEQAIKALGIPYTRSDVGDIQVLGALQSRDWLLGGESSGHVISLKHATTGDGLLTALLLLEVLATTAQDLHSLNLQMPRYPQTLRNIACTKPKTLLKTPMVQSEIEAATAALGEAGRVLVRASGTEPLLRIMVEAQTEDLVETYATRLEEKLFEFNQMVDCQD